MKSSSLSLSCLRLCPHPKRLLGECPSLKKKRGFTGATPAALQYRRTVLGPGCFPGLSPTSVCPPTTHAPSSGSPVVTEAYDPLPPSQLHSQLCSRSHSLVFAAQADLSYPTRIPSSGFEFRDLCSACPAQLPVVGTRPVLGRRGRRGAGPVRHTFEAEQERQSFPSWESL